jgi:tetratricopeptide (TPR) repeat protein
MNLWEQGIRALKQNHAAQAEVVFERVLTAEPTCRWARFDLGLAKRALGKTGTALRIHRELSREDPADFENWVALANLCAGRRWYKKSLQYYDEALRIRPRSAVVHYNLGITHEEMGRTRDALSCYGKALRLQPRLWVASMRLVSLLENRGDNEAALSVLDAALGHQPGEEWRGELLYEKGCVLARAERFDEARKCFRAVARVPEHARSGDAKECIEDLS